MHFLSLSWDVIPAVFIGLAFLSSPGTVTAQTPASITVHADSPVATIPPLALGLDTAVWDGLLNDAPVPALLREAGITALRYPGGSTADGYHWQTHSATAGIAHRYRPDTAFDAFMSVARQVGAHPIITVNYGSNPAGDAGADPAEAAAWVDYANNVKHYGVQYWEIGNEIYGNGEYGSGWETDFHPGHTPSAYGYNVVLFSQAMKGKDPTIQIGVDLVTPDGWPDGITPDWNSGVLAVCGRAIDFVSVHAYAQEPGQESDARLLATPAQYAAKLAKLRALINRHCGPNAAAVQICVTELNSISNRPGKQSISLVNALFLADACPTLLENGVATADWWDLHNGPEHHNNNPSLYGDAAFGDYGILSAGKSPEPAAETPFPPYFGMQMLSKLGKPGDVLVNTSSTQPLLAAHAVQQANGSLALLLINKDPVQSFTANVSISGYTPTSSATDYFYGQPGGTGGLTIAPGTAGSTFERTVPPYSLTTVVMQPDGGSPAPTPTPRSSNPPETAR